MRAVIRCAYHLTTITFSPSAWSEGICAIAAPRGRGLPGGQIQPVTAPLLLGLQECSVCSLLDLSPPYCDRLMLEMTEVTLITTVGASRFLLLLEEPGKKMSETSNSEGLCARISPDCVSVFAEVNTLEQFISKMTEPGCVQTRDACCYCFALHIMSTQAAANTCEGSKIVSCSAPLHWDLSTLPTHTLQLRTVKYPHFFLGKSEGMQVIRQSQTSSASFANVKRTGSNVLSRYGVLSFSSSRKCCCAPKPFMTHSQSNISSLT